MWLEKGFEEITDSSNSATFDTLDKMVIWPSSIEGWIWGTGEDLFNNRYGRNSDIGYSSVELWWIASLFFYSVMAFGDTFPSKKICE